MEYQGLSAREENRTVANADQPSLVRRLPGFGRRAPRRREPWPWLKPGHLPRRSRALVWMALRAGAGALSANPIAEIENELGLTALVFLLASLACTPPNDCWAGPGRCASAASWTLRLLLCHAALLAYLVLDQFFDWGAIVADIAPAAVSSPSASLRWC